MYLSKIWQNNWRRKILYTTSCSSSWYFILSISDLFLILYVLLRGVNWISQKQGRTLKNETTANVKKIFLRFRQFSVTLRAILVSPKKTPFRRLMLARHVVRRGFGLATLKNRAEFIFRKYVGTLKLVTWFRECLLISVFLLTLQYVWELPE